MSRRHSLCFSLNCDISEKQRRQQQQQQQRQKQQHMKKKNNDQNEYVKTLVTSYTIMNIGLSSCHNVYNIKNQKLDFVMILLLFLFDYDCFSFFSCSIFQCLHIFFSLSALCFWYLSKHDTDILRHVQFNTRALACTHTHTIRHVNFEMDL